MRSVGRSPRALEEFCSANRINLIDAWLTTYNDTAYAYLGRRIITTYSAPLQINFYNRAVADSTIKYKIYSPQKKKINNRLFIFKGIKKQYAHTLTVLLTHTQKVRTTEKKSN